MIQKKKSIMLVIGQDVISIKKIIKIGLKKFVKEKEKEKEEKKKKKKELINKL